MASEAPVEGREPALPAGNVLTPCPGHSGHPDHPVPRGERHAKNPTTGSGGRERCDPFLPWAGTGGKSVMRLLQHPLPAVIIDDVPESLSSFRSIGQENTR